MARLPLHLECQKAAVVMRGRDWDSELKGLEERALAGCEFSLGDFLEEAAFELNLRAGLGRGGALPSSPGSDREPRGKTELGKLSMSRV